MMLGALMVITGSGAQSPKIGSAAHKPRVVAKANSVIPVTQAEVRAVFTRVNQVLTDAEMVKTPIGNSPIPDSIKTATRAQVISEMSRVYQAASPSFKLNLKAVPVDSYAIRLPDLASRQKIRVLIAAGAVAKYGPLVSGPTMSLTVAEFGDAVGFFLARISELTHMPSRKWTPYLHG